MLKQAMVTGKECTYKITRNIATLLHITRVGAVTTVDSEQAADKAVSPLAFTAPVAGLSAWSYCPYCMKGGSPCPTPNHCLKTR